MSLSPISDYSAKITPLTAYDISNEILGGAIQFCREAGYRQNITMFTFFWSAFLLSAKDELSKQNILEEVQNNYVRSISNIFSDLHNDPDYLYDVNHTRHDYWLHLSSDFIDISTDDEITALLYIANHLNNKGFSKSIFIPNDNAHVAFSRIRSGVFSGINRILHQTGTEMTIEYKGIVESFPSNNSTKISTATNQYSSTPQNIHSVPQKQLGMKWYNFVIYCQLILAPIFNIIYGLGYLTGTIYEVESNGQLSADRVYRYYGDSLKHLDILFGLSLIGIAALGFVLRHKLAKYNYDGIKLLFLYHSLIIAIDLVYILSFVSITSESVQTSTISSLLIQIGLLIANIVYFKKRTHLFSKPSRNPIEFKNSPPVSGVTETQIQANTVEASSLNNKIQFCRRCGNKLTDDSLFCNKCGTKIYIDNDN